MIKYKILDVLLNSLNVDVLTPPAIAIKSKKIKFNLNYSCNFEISQNELVMSYPNFILNILNSLDDNDDKKESNFVNIEIAYFVVIKIEKKEKLDKQKIEDFLSKELKKVILPYFNSEINTLLIKAGYPPMYNYIML